MRTAEQLQDPERDEARLGERQKDQGRLLRQSEKAQRRLFHAKGQKAQCYACAAEALASAFEKKSESAFGIG